MPAPITDEHRRALTRGVAEIIPEADLRERLASGNPLRVKLGLDPTAEHVTLGWAVVLRLLRRFQDLGHTAVLIVGDFTARIGDPSGRSKTRKPLSADEVDRYAERVLDQFALVLSKENLEVRRNSEWLSPLDATDILRLTSHTTVAQMLQRDDFAKRFEANESITLTELLYPLMQGYDSVAVEADVELGGTDQTFNLLVGRDLQRAHDQEPQVVVTMPLLVGTDGTQKMSQSLGNYIGLTEAPDEMFGKLMRVPDEAMADYFLLATDVDPDEIPEILAGRPEHAKRRLAEEVVRIYHGPDAAKAARERFDQVFREHETPEDVPTHQIPANGTVHLPKLLTEAGLAPSSSQARRLIDQGGVHIGQDTVTDLDVPVEELRGRVVRVGKRRFMRFT